MAAELNSCDRDGIAVKPKVFTVWPFKKTFADSYSRLFWTTRYTPRTVVVLIRQVLEDRSN